MPLAKIRAGQVTAADWPLRILAMQCHVVLLYALCHGAARSCNMHMPILRELKTTQGAPYLNTSIGKSKGIVAHNLKALAGVSLAV